MTELTHAQVRAFDKHAIEQLGIPAAVLMENAGRGAAEILMALGVHGRVVICCGKGNNGGDGLVIARHLTNAGFDVLTLLFAQPEHLSPDAAIQWNIVQKMGLATQVWADAKFDEANLTALFAKAEWIVDALFGTGLTGPVRPPFDRIIDLINTASARHGGALAPRVPLDSRSESSTHGAARVLAVDIPTGLDCDTGEPLGPTIRAEHSVTFVAAKVGFRNPASLDFTGRVHVVDIGIVLE